MFANDELYVYNYEGQNSMEKVVTTFVNDSKFICWWYGLEIIMDIYMFAGMSKKLGYYNFH